MRSAFALPFLAVALLAQEPTPAPAPTPSPTPAPAPAPGHGERPAPTPGHEAGTGATQDPQPAGGERSGERAGRGPGGQGGPGGRRRGPGGQGPGSQELTELPEFTPVAAPPVEALQGKQSFWFTMYPHFLVQYDPVTDTVAKQVELKRGMFWSTHLTHDRKRMLVVTGQQQVVEVVDLATGTVVGEHTFAEDGFILRIREVRECPGGAHWLVRTERVKKEVDRYSFEAAQWLLYDVAAQKVTRKIRRLPEVLDRGAQLSADGTSWLATNQDGNLQFLDARTFKETATIELNQQRYFGSGTIRLTGNDLLDRRDARRALMLYTTTDPVETRRTSWGLVELNLVDKTITSVQEWGPNQNSFGLRISYKKLVAAAMAGGFGRGDDDNKMRLVMIDLKTGQKIAEANEEFRPRRSLVAISPEGDKVYIGTAGSDFEVFDANLKRLKTVELPGEIVGRIYTIDG